MQTRSLLAITASFIIAAFTSPAHAGWPGPAKQKSAPTGTAKAKKAYLGRLLTLDGEKSHGRSLFNDHVKMRIENGVIRHEVDRAKYVLLIVSHAECKWTGILAEELLGKLPAWRREGVRIALVVIPRKGHGPKKYRRFQDEGIPVLTDPSRKTYAHYVKTRTPSVSLISGFGDILYAFEGYLPGDTLLAKLRKGDFSRVAPSGG